MTVSSVNQSDWIAGERIRRGEIVYWEPSDDMVWRLDVESAKSKQDRIIGIATNDVRKGGLVDVAMTSSPPSPRYSFGACDCGTKAPVRLLNRDTAICDKCGEQWRQCAGRWIGPIADSPITPTGFKGGDSLTFSTDGAPAETVALDAKDALRRVGQVMRASGVDVPVRLECPCGQAHTVVGDLGQFTCKNCSRKWWQDGKAWHVEDDGQIKATGPTIKSRIITDYKQWVDAFGPKPSKPKRPPSRHQARLEKHAARRPLPGDKRAKPEGKGRRWFWPLVAAFLMLVSGIAGAITIADKWPLF